MASEVILPKQGNSVESCIIVGWTVDEGEPVTKGDVILEVETDKATMQVESTADGVLLKHLVAEGDDVPVLTPIALVGEPGEQIDAVTPPDDASHDGRRGEAGRDGGAPTPVAAASIPSASIPSAPDSEHEAPSRRRRGGAKISPRARRFAETKRVAVEHLSGSGPGGRIMVRDVEAAIASGGAHGAGERDAAKEPTATEPTATGGAGVRGGVAPGPAQPVSETAIKGVRKLIAERMHASIASTAQLTMDAAADARAILSYRKRLKAASRERVRDGYIALAEISINDLVLYAVSRALAGFPNLNSTFRDGVIRVYDQVDLGFAVDTPKGLMVPVIRGAERRSLVDLATEAHRLATSCLDGTAKPDELSGGTFTVTNLGVFGIERFTPVLNVPQVAILGVCAVTQRPAPDGAGSVPMMGLSLTIDHQVVDGAPAARFLQSVSRAIAEIDLTLAQ